MLATVGKSDTAEVKKRIQALLRQGVIARDGGCLLRNIRHCNGLPGVTGVVLQADHLITRANSATFGDMRLVVCLCKRCHSWKSLGDNLRKAQYDQLVRSLLPQDRVALWDKAEQDMWRPHPMRENDWRLVEVALAAELAALSNVQCSTYQ
jgi:hypothetical protein